jgi:hypothetical protein
MISDEERIAQARQARDESAGRHKSAQSRKASCARRVKRNSTERPVAPCPDEDTCPEADTCPDAGLATE